MGRQARNKVNALSEADFSDCVLKSRSYRDVCVRLGYGGSGLQNGRVRDRIRLLKIDTSHFIRRAQPKALENVMVENSSYDRGNLKKQLMCERIIPYVCALCSLKPFWNDKPLVLRLDHVNGVNNDHRRDNLRFVCPNCDSQLPTFAGRNARKSRVV